MARRVQRMSPSYYSNACLIKQEKLLGCKSIFELVANEWNVT